MARRGRLKAEPTDDDWELLLPLFAWPEQEEYERIRPLVLFGASVAERAKETGTPERTMYRRVERFEKDGMLSLFGTDPATARAKRRGLEPAIRRMIVELKAEHPALNNSEISNIVYVRTGRKLGKHTAGRVLAEEVLPLKLSRLFEPYHETKNGRERREAVVALHLDGWSVKAIASYLKVSRMTVYRVVGRWLREGEAGLEDRPIGRPKGVRKMDLATMDFIRRTQENPELGAFRIHAALEQKRGAEVSVRTVGRVMAVHRDLYGLGKPKRSPNQKKEMPFRANSRHEIWTSDVRYIDHSLAETGNVYVISILENYSRAILASAVTLSQDTNAYLSVLYAAIERYGSPKAIVTDGGGIFRSRQASAVYGALWASRKKKSIVGNPGKASSRPPSTPSAVWPTITSRKRKALAGAGGGTRALARGLQHAKTLGPPGHRRRPKEPLGGSRMGQRCPLPSGGSRKGVLLDTLHAEAGRFGLRTPQDWRVYGEEGLARCEVALWLGKEGLSVQYGGQTLSRYEVSLSGAAKLKDVKNPQLFLTSYQPLQLKLFALEGMLGEGGWLKALWLEEYAARTRLESQALQQVLFAYT